MIPRISPCPVETRNAPLPISAEEIRARSPSFTRSVLTIRPSGLHTRTISVADECDRISKAPGSDCSQIPPIDRLSAIRRSEPGPSRVWEIAEVREIDGAVAQLENTNAEHAIRVLLHQQSVCPFQEAQAGVIA